MCYYIITNIFLIDGAKFPKATVKEYVNKFDEFLNRYNILDNRVTSKFFLNFVLDFE